MRYLDSDLGDQKAGAVANVTLRGSEANVFLVDQLNFDAYRAGRRYTYYGGHVQRSPVRLTVPHAGHWHLVVDLGGGAGHVEAAVSVSA